MANCDFLLSFSVCVHRTIFIIERTDNRTTFRVKNISCRNVARTQRCAELRLGPAGPWSSKAIAILRRRSYGPKVPTARHNSGCNKLFAVCCHTSYVKKELQTVQGETSDKCNSSYIHSFTFILKYI